VKVPEKVPGSIGVGEALVQSQVRFNRVPEGSGEDVGGFGAEPGPVQQGFRRRFQRRFREALVQSQVRFNRVPEKVPEVCKALVQSQVRFNRVPLMVWEALVEPG